MPFPLIGALASLGSSLFGAGAANRAGDAQAQAIKKASKLQQGQFDETKELLQPSIAAGNTARGYQLGALGLPGGVPGADTTAAFRDSPGYQFALGQGRDQVLTSAGATGNLFSGKSIKALASYGQGMADQNFGNWYDRLGGLSGAGNNAVGTVANAGQGTANNRANLAVGGGDARASSYINGANAVTGGVQNLADLANYYGFKRAPTQPQPPRGWMGGVY